MGIGLEQVTRLALRAGQVDAAHSSAAEAVDVQEHIGYTEGVIASLHLLGRAALASGDAANAETHHIRALRLAQTIGHAAAMCEALEDLAQLAVIAGDEPRATSLLQLAEDHRVAHSLPRRHDEDSWTGTLRREIGATTTPPGPDRPLDDAVRDVLRTAGYRHRTTDHDDARENV